MTKVYDCFPFFNEFTLLEVRLREIADLVDVFVLIEGSTTHTGIPKPFYFEQDKELFQRLSGGKIVHYAATLPIEGANTWGREILQRSYINHVLADLKPDDNDIILSSDVDEIPRARVIQEYRDHNVDGVCCIEEKTYNYDLNCQMEQPTLDPKICRYRDLKREGAADLRYYHTAWPTPVIKDGGWHLSFMGGTDKIIEKMRSYAHYDERDPNTATYLSRENVESSVKARKSLFLRDDVKYRHVKDFSDMPKHIMENLPVFIKNGWIVDPP